MTSVPLYSLPIELLEAFLAELAYPDLENAQNVSHAWRTLCNSTAIPYQRKKLIELRHIAKSDSHTAILRRNEIDPFVLSDFNRHEYLTAIGDDVPPEFASYVLETPLEEIIGWHWPGLDAYNRDRFIELGRDWSTSMQISKFLKPGYSLLPLANVLEVEDPDYSDFNNTDLHFYPGSWQLQRPLRETRVKALQVWADLSGSTQKHTLLILSGSERWDGKVWLTETRSPFRHGPETIDGTVQLIWHRPLGSWTDYLKSECKALQDGYRSLTHTKRYRSGLRGPVWISPAE